MFERWIPTKVGDAINQYYKQWGVYENMALYSPDGKTVFRTDGTSINVANQSYFQKALAGETSISDPLISKATGNIVFVVATPVIEKDQIVGVCAGSVPTLVFAEIINASNVGSGDGYLINNRRVSNHSIQSHEGIHQERNGHHPDRIGIDKQIQLRVKTSLQGKHLLNNIQIYLVKLLLEVMLLLRKPVGD